MLPTYVGNKCGKRTWQPIVFQRPCPCIKKYYKTQQKLDVFIFRRTIKYRNENKRIGTGKIYDQ